MNFRIISEEGLTPPQAPFSGINVIQTPDGTLLCLGHRDCNAVDTTACVSILLYHHANSLTISLLQDANTAKSIDRHSGDTLLRVSQSSG